MPDIAMCMNKDCPSRNECWRFRAVPSDLRQMYVEFKPAEGRNRCDAFWPIGDRPVAPLEESNA